MILRKWRFPHPKNRTTGKDPLKRRKTMNAIECKGLRKEYPGKVAVKGLELAVKEGARVAAGVPLFSVAPEKE